MRYQIQCGRIACRPYKIKVNDFAAAQQIGKANIAVGSKIVMQSFEMVEDFLDRFRDRHRFGLNAALGDFKDAALGGVEDPLQ